MNNQPHQTPGVKSGCTIIGILFGVSTVLILACCGGFTMFVAGISQDLPSPAPANTNQLTSPTPPAHIREGGVRPPLPAAVTESPSTSTVPLVGASADAPPLHDEVTLSLEIVHGEYQSVRVRGKTNLPSGTSLMISIDERAPGGFSGGDKCVVFSDGTFESKTFGDEPTLPPGAYSASVRVPIPRVQSEAVRRIIGTNGEHLRGPLVKRDGDHVTVTAEQMFVVGGEKAIEQQRQFLAARRQALLKLQAEVRDRYAQLESARKRLSPQSEDVGDLAKWGEFARDFNKSHDLIQNRIEKGPSSYARSCLSIATGHLWGAFVDTASGNHKSYAENIQRYKEIMREASDDLKSFKEGSNLSNARDWSTADGKFTVNAELISKTNDSVRLRRSDDGREIDVPLDRLSPADQQIVEEWAKTKR